MINWALGYLAVAVARTLLILPKTEVLAGLGESVAVGLAEKVLVGVTSIVGKAVGVGVAWFSWMRCCSRVLSICPIC